MLELFELNSYLKKRYAYEGKDKKDYRYTSGTIYH